MRYCNFKSSVDDALPRSDGPRFLVRVAGLGRHIGRFLPFGRGARKSVARLSSGAHDVVPFVAIEQQWSTIVHHLRTRLDEQQHAVELHAKAAQIVSALDYEMSRFMTEVGQHLSGDRTYPAVVRSGAGADYRRPVAARLAA